MTPVPREAYPVPVPQSGRWQEIINTDASIYGGSGLGNASGGNSAGVLARTNGSGQMLTLHLPPLATLILRPVDAAGSTGFAS
jgi:1,4-alpha-glucan branching enzyme